jgi:hypothetical protein
VVEDYVIFQVESLSPSLDISQFLASHGRQIAQILRAESRPLSDQEIDDALSARLSYGREDLAVIDWNAALLIDRDGDDVREVLQFGNVELLEMRYLDQRLDGALESSYVALSPRAGSSRPKQGRYRSRLRSVAELQVDNATLFEGAQRAETSGLTFGSDLRPVSAGSIRYWDASILRKLQTLESIPEDVGPGLNTTPEAEWHYHSTVFNLLSPFRIRERRINLKPTGNKRQVISDESRLASMSGKTFQSKLAIEIDVIERKDRESSRERAGLLVMRPDIGFVQMSGQR